MSEIVEEERKRCARHPCKTLTTSLITNLPDDCLNLIFLGLKTSIDRSSFGLTCRQWLRIQNYNHESLWFHSPLSSDTLLEIGPENFSIILCKLLARFQYLKFLSLSGCPELTDVVTSQSQYFGSHIQVLYLDSCSKLSDIKLCLMLSWFPRLTTISLKNSRITDKGLEILAQSCSSLQNVNLSKCQLISDSGVKFVSQNCRQLCSLCISDCRNIKGIGLHGCSQTLSYLEAEGCNLESEGIKAIVSGGGIEHMNLAGVREPFCYKGEGYELSKIGEGFAINLRVLNLQNCGSVVNNRTVTVISKGCPSLQVCNLGFCYMVDLEGWQAIGLNCHNLEELDVTGFLGLKDLGLQALCDGCSKLTKLHIWDLNNISFPAEKMFDSKRPNVI
ncbi:F-box/LRR-repeat protein 12-like [Papaver somniferum]|nr:F-box/LRR-repeat protein 12-like [Papaver somniferum]